MDNKTTFQWFVLMGVLFSEAVLAQPNSCDDQQIDLNNKIKHAEVVGNHTERDRVALALEKVQAYCTPARQRARAQDDIDHRQHQLQEAERELVHARQDEEKARQQGRPDKISKRQHKVAEKEQKVMKKQKAFQEAQKVLAGLPE